MKRLLLSAMLIIGCAISAISAPGQTNVAPATKPAPGTAQERPAAAKARSLPYRGKLVLVDKQRSSVTVGTRVFLVTPKTKVEKEGKPATLNDGVAGQLVTGSYRKLPDGRLEAVSLYFGGKTGASSSGGNSTPRTQKQ